MKKNIQLIFISFILSFLFFNLIPSEAMAAINVYANPIPNPAPVNSEVTIRITATGASFSYMYLIVDGQANSTDVHDCLGSQNCVHDFKRTFSDEGEYRIFCQVFKTDQTSQDCYSEVELVVGPAGISPDNDPPSISNLTPTFGPVSTSLIISGEKFCTHNTSQLGMVIFDQTAVEGGISQSIGPTCCFCERLVATVPSLIPDNYVTVKVSTGDGVSIGFPFFVILANCGESGGTWCSAGYSCDGLNLNSYVSDAGEHSGQICCEGTCRAPSVTPPPATPPAGGIISIDNPLKADTFAGLIEAIIKFIFTISLAVVPLMIIIGGVFYVTSAGDTQRLEQAKNLIMWTVIGFAIILFSRGLVAIIEQVIGGVKK